MSIKVSLHRINDFTRREIRWFFDEYAENCSSLILAPEKQKNKLYQHFKSIYSLYLLNSTISVVSGDEGEIQTYLVWETLEGEVVIHFMWGNEKFAKYLLKSTQSYENLLNFRNFSAAATENFPLLKSLCNYNIFLDKTLSYKIYQDRFLLRRPFRGRE